MGTTSFWESPERQEAGSLGQVPDVRKVSGIRCQVPHLSTRWSQRACCLRARLMGRERERENWVAS